jgi:hypothetical protein
MTRLETERRGLRLEIPYVGRAKIEQSWMYMTLAAEHRPTAVGAEKTRPSMFGPT